MLNQTRNEELAQVFPVGDFIKEELAARGISETDFAERLRWPVERLQEILAGSNILIREAEEMAKRLGVSAALLLTLQLSWLRRHGPKESTDA